jgi:hypothetical protein
MWTVWLGKFFISSCLRFLICKVGLILLDLFRKITHVPKVLSTVPIAWKTFQKCHHCYYHCSCYDLDTLAHTSHSKSLISWRLWWSWMLRDSSLNIPVAQRPLSLICWSIHAFFFTHLTAFAEPSPSCPADSSALPVYSHWIYLFYLASLFMFLNLCGQLGRI